MLVALYVCCTDGARKDRAASTAANVPAGVERNDAASTTATYAWIMARGAAVLNTITTAGRTVLLTRTGGLAIHLTASANDSDDPQPAVRSHTWPSSQPRDADASTNLTDRRWAPRTLCGTQWNTMAGFSSTGGSTDDDRTPTCRRCLAIVDRWFPEPVPDERIGLLAELASGAVHRYGTAEVVGVPGDQHTALRRAVRDELKQRHGYSAKTFVIDDRVVISSNDTTEALRAEMAKQFHRAFNSDEHDAVPIDDSAWRFHWRTWSTA